MRRLFMVAAFSVAMYAQRPAAAPPRSGQAGAPIDLTGYWVSQIVDEWRFRVAPLKGDIPYLPINAEARKIALAWDPDKDVADGTQCKAYGAVGVMQRPGRLHITWKDENTLQIDADAGTQTRILHFGQAAAEGDPTWQGSSVAQWQVRKSGGSLKVVTTKMKPGYIRKNGVPYSGSAVLTEYMNVLAGQQGDAYLAVTASV